MSFRLAFQILLAWITCWSQSRATFTTTVEVLDLTNEPGNLKGFYGGFADDTYGYLVPKKNNDDSVRHGKVTRFDLATFSLIEVLDLTLTHPKLKGFHYGLAHGAHGYLMPFKVAHNPTVEPSGKVGRFLLASFDTVEVLDLEITHPKLHGFKGTFEDGTYAYLVPSVFSMIARFQLATFSNVEVLDISATKCAGGFIDGAHGYVMAEESSEIFRFSLSTFGDVEVLDLQLTNPIYTTITNGFSDGTYGYAGSGIANDEHRIIRFSLDSFANNDVTHLDIAGTWFNQHTQGFYGGFSKDGFGYMFPGTNEVVRFRLDTFSDASLYDLCTNFYDLGDCDPELFGFRSGFLKGSYGYLVPNEYHKIVRFGVTTSTTTSPPSSSPPSSSPQSSKPAGASSSSTSTREPTAKATRRLQGEMILTVSSASQFVGEQKLAQALQESIAAALSIPMEWVHDVVVSMQRSRMLKVAAQSHRILQEGDVEVRWFISVPPDGTDIEGKGVTVTIIADRVDSMTLSETTQIIQKTLDQISLSQGYEVKVTWKYIQEVECENCDEEEQAEQEDDDEATDSIITVFAIAAGASSVALAMGLALYCRILRKRRTKAFQEFGDASGSFSIKPGDVLYFRPGDLLQEWDKITSEQAELVRNLVRVMHEKPVAKATVFVTFATGHRDQDEEGIGPGTIYAAALMKLLYDSGVQCLCDMMLSSDESRSKFTDAIEVAICKDSCKLLLVLQTQALYESSSALKDIYTAQQHNVELLPIRFEANLPSQSEQWPEITREDIKGMLMVSQVQQHFSQLIPVPVPPDTALSHPDFLQELLYDVQEKLMKETNVSPLVSNDSRASQIYGSKSVSTILVVDRTSSAPSIEDGSVQKKKSNGSSAKKKSGSREKSFERASSKDRSHPRSNSGASKEKAYDRSNAKAARGDARVKSKSDPVFSPASSRRDRKEKVEKDSRISNQ